MEQVVGHHEEGAADVTDQVVSGKELALDLPKDFPGEIGEKERRLDKSEIKQGAVPEDKGEEVNEAENDHGYPVTLDGPYSTGKHPP